MYHKRNNAHLLGALVVLLTVLALSGRTVADDLVDCDNVWSWNDNCVVIADYLVAAVGASGAPLIRRLSDDSRYSVIAFEAGRYLLDDPNVKYGASAYNVYGDMNTYFWPMKTEYDPVRGKVDDIMVGYGSGGGSAVNGMMYTRPTQAYLKQLNQWGGADWTPAAVNADYKTIENFTIADGPSIASTRGTNGYINVRRPPVGPTSGSGALAALLAKWTAGASGINITADYNDPTKPSNAFGAFERYQLFQTPEGERETSVNAFLPKSILNPDGTSADPNRQLRVFWEAEVQSVIIDPIRKVARGLVYLINGKTRTAYARKEVVLANNIFTSKILQNSGIGPADLLTANGIDVIVNNPNVGINLQNHVSISLPFIANPLHGVGYPGNDYAVLYSGGAFLPSWNAPGPLTNVSLLSETRKYQLIWFAGFTSLFVGPLQPKSTGYEKISSAATHRNPRHNDLSLTDPFDLNDFASFLYNFVQNTLFPYIHSQDSAYEIGWAPWTSVEDAKAYIKANSGKTLHYCCHARMAPSAAQGVVDSRGRVFGVPNLRVVGAAAFPTVPDATPASLAELHGWRVAGFMIQDRKPRGYFKRRGARRAH
eukprot:TRINITY_DN524_c0_g1_i1.p1 TRINITY_DN524_c0_g1~~TRINITY_DN524_c0_g1_i1.p1  ORF type:complete len:597 (-),score=118.50 TRINITY_DN524_c0_g1_i1:172-1962(-)